MCIDATVVPVFGKRGTSKRSERVPIDPDAGWYVREGDHRDGEDKKYRKSAWGYEATLVTMVTNDPAENALFPRLILAIGFGKPGVDIAGHGSRTLNSIAKRGHPAGLAVADRAYLPSSKPEDLQLPLRALGYGLVFDYKESQLGITASYEGAIQVEGAWYCPQMPTPLIEATIDFRAKESIDIETYAKRIEQRRRYLLRPKAKPDHDGYTPMMCPAAGASATVACPLKRQTKDRFGLTHLAAVPVSPSKICTNRSSVSFPPTAGAKYAQTLPYGSPEWHAMYASARNTIEGFNGYVKDANYGALDQPGRRRMVGYSAQYLLATLSVAAANVRKVHTFLAEEERRQPLTAPVRRPRRRDRLADCVHATNATAKGNDPPV